MNAVYLISVIVALSVQNIAKKPYTQKTSDNGVYCFNAIVSFVAMIFFILTGKGLTFSLDVLPYSIGFAISYATTSVFSLMAISCGSLSLTSLFMSYSLMIPTFYGLIFLKDPVSIGLIPGIILLIISLLLINKKSGDNKISFKWLLFASLAFAGNGMCSTFQKMQQVAFEGAYKSEFMIMSLAMVCVSMIVLALITARKEIGTHVKAGWYLAIVCGLMNGTLNLFVMILTNRMPASLMFPLISAGGIVLTYLVSRFLYKETLTKTQFIGFVIGVASIIFLNI